jgi:hypothetical protein
MKNTKTFFRGLLSVLFLTVLLLNVTGCIENVSDYTYVSPYGTYTSLFGETYVITETTFNYTSHMEYEGITYDTVKTGTDVAIQYLTTTAGIIYYKDTTENKWAATAYKDITASGISLSNAYKLDGKAYCDTLEEAKQEFTIENGYFALFGEYAKQ